jgi:hypothetical protein
MKVIVIIVAVMCCYLQQGCVSSSAPMVLTANENGMVLKLSHISPTMAVTGFITSFAMAHCSVDPKFRGCSDIHCQVDIKHPNCTPEAIKRLKKKGVL